MARSILTTASTLEGLVLSRNSFLSFVETCLFISYFDICRTGQGQGSVYLFGLHLVPIEVQNLLFQGVLVKTET